MRTPEEIREYVNAYSANNKGKDYEALMLEIMCNIAISLDRIAKEIWNEE